MRGLAGACYAVGKPARIKPVGIGTPDNRIPVSQRYWDSDVGSFWNVEAANF